MRHLTEDQLIASLRWRYATKRFDASKKIPAHTWETLEQALILTPSSFGLQPWRFLVVRTPELRQKLREASWGQGQITDASHLVVFTVRSQNTPEDIDAYIRMVAEVRNQPVDSPSLQGYRKVVLAFEKRYSDAEWNARQVYIALGNFMTSAALLGVDTCPLEGIDANQYDAILDLPRQGYTTAMVCAAGYRASDDKYAALPKIRFPRNEVIREL